MAQRREVEINTGSLLLSLYQAHERVLQGMEELGRLTRDASPDVQLLSQARWKLSTASLGRRMLWSQILAHLFPAASDEARAELTRLQQLDLDLLESSTQHIASWTIDVILTDWTGYCAASRDIRWKMIARMEEEKRVLYPMLRAIVRPAGSGPRCHPIVHSAGLFH